MGYKTKYHKLIIYGCPHCKKYLPKDDKYKFCMYCGKAYKKDKLIVLNTIRIRKTLLEESK